ADVELGIVTPVVEQDVPLAVRGNLRFTVITARNGHTCGITPDGSVYCWGGNRFGQIGDGSTENRYSPVPIDPKLKFKLITAGGNDFSGHTCGITTDGRTLCWGDNRWGQLGNGSTDATVTPALAADPSEE